MISEEVESERRYSFYFENLDEETSIESETGDDGEETSNVHFQEYFKSFMWHKLCHINKELRTSRRDQEPLDL